MDVVIPLHLQAEGGGEGQVFQLDSVHVHLLARDLNGGLAQYCIVGDCLTVYECISNLLEAGTQSTVLLMFITMLHQLKQRKFSHMVTLALYTIMNNTFPQYRCF